MPNTKSNIYTFLALFLVLIIDAMGIGLVLPLLGPLFINKTSMFVSAGMTIPVRDILYGVTIASFCLFMFFGAPFLGDLSDHLGRKKVLLLCLFGTALGLVVSALGVDLHSITILILGRCIAGFMAGSQSLAQAAIVDISTKDNKAKNLSLISLASCVGFVLGPVLSGITSNPHLYHSFGLATPFWLAGGLAAFNGICLLFTFKETYFPKAKQKLKLTKGLDVFISAFTNKLVRKLTIIYFIAESGWALFFQFIPIYLIGVYNASTTDISHLMAWMGTWFGITMLIIVRIVEKFTKIDKIIIPSFLLNAIGALLLLIHNPIVLWISIIPATVGGGLFYIGLLTKFSNTVDEDSQGWVMGVFAAAVGVSWSLTGFLSGALGIISINFPFVIAAGLLVLSVLLSLA